MKISQLRGLLDHAAMLTEDESENYYRCLDRIA